MTTDDVIAVTFLVKIKSNKRYFSFFGSSLADSNTKTEQAALAELRKEITDRELYRKIHILKIALFIHLVIDSVRSFFFFFCRENSPFSEALPSPRSSRGKPLEEVMRKNKN